MGIRVFAVWVLLVVSSIYAAPVKIALIGDSAKCDLLTAELSEDNNIELLEREQVKRILKEHQLSEQGLTAVKLIKAFPHVDLFVVIDNDRMVIFNAKNGFRLWDGSTDSAAIDIKQSIKKLTRENSFYLSIISTRNVAVPEKLTKSIQQIVTQYEQDLMKYPNIQMLERKRLDLVTEERSFTGKEFPLKASGRLITLQFEPTGKDNEITISLAMRDLSENLVASASITSSLENAGDASTKLCRKTYELLTKDNPTAAALENEALSFFKEYKRLIKTQKIVTWQGGRKILDYPTDKLFSALALAPDNEEIRLAVLKYYSEVISSMKVPDKVTALPVQWERIKKFINDFPESKLDFSLDSLLFGDIISNYSSHWTPQFIEVTKKILEELRPLNIKVLRAQLYHCDLTDGINSLNELFNFTNLVEQTTWDHLYIDRATWLEQRLEQKSILLHETQKYTKAHPEEKDKVNEIIKYVYLADIFRPDTPIDKASVKKYLQNTKDLCAFVASSDLDMLKGHYLLLDMMRETFDNASADVFSKAIDDYYKTIEKIQPGYMLPRQDDRECKFYQSNDYYTLKYYCEKLINNDHLLDSRLALYYKKNNIDPGFNELYRVLMTDFKSYSPDINKYTDSFKKYNLQRFTNNNYSNACNSMMKNLFGNDSKNQSIKKEWMDFFYTLNSDFDIQTEAYHCIPGNTQNGAPLQLCGAAENNGEVAIFLDNMNIMLRKRDGTMQKLPKPNSMLRNDNWADVWVWKKPITLSDSYLAFVDDQRNLEVYNFSTAKWSVIRDFATTNVTDLFIHSGRVYALAGCTGITTKKDNNFMISCNIDGTNRKVHFSSERDIKQIELDKIRGGLSGLSKLSDNKLVFLVTPEKDCVQIWEYDITKDIFKMLYKANFYGNHSSLFWKGRDNLFYLSSCGWSERQYRFKPDDFKPEWFFSQGDNDGKKIPADQHPVLLGLRDLLSPPMRVNGNTLWFGGYRSAYFDISDPMAPQQLLLLPQTQYVFELGDGKIMYLGLHRYFIIKKHVTL